MTIVIYLPLLVCLVGLAMWCWVDPTKHPHANAAGHDMFWVGLLAFLLSYRAIPALGAYIH